MKTRHIITLAALACICWAMTSCVTTTAPDGTVTTTPAPGSVEAGLELAHILAEK